MLRELQLCLMLAALVLCTSAQATPITTPEAPPFDLPGAGQPGSVPPFDTPPVAEAPVDAPPFGLPPAPVLPDRGNAGGSHPSAARELIELEVFHPRAEEFGLPDPFFSVVFAPGEGPPQLEKPAVPSEFFVRGADASLQLRAGDDELVWATASVSGASASASVPEPSALALLALATVAVLMRASRARAVALSTSERS